MKTLWEQNSITAYSQIVQATHVCWPVPIVWTDWTVLSGFHPPHHCQSSLGWRLGDLDVTRGIGIRTPTYKTKSYKYNPSFHAGIAVLCSWLWHSAIWPNWQCACCKTAVDRLESPQAPRSDAALWNSRPMHVCQNVLEMYDQDLSTWNTWNEIDNH